MSKQEGLFGAKVGRFESRPGYVSVAPTGVDAAQWASNPYATFDYRHTWWQKLFEGLGFRSKFDEYRDSMALNAAEYEAQLAEKAHNEQYDSAQEQVNRQRLAGINPDIAGNVGAGASSPTQPDPNAPISPGSDDPVQILSGFANVVMSAFTGSIGLAKDVFSLSQLKNTVDSGRIGNSQSIVDYAMSLARQFIPESYPEGDPDWVNRASDLAFDIGSQGLNKHQQKQFREALRSFYSSSPTQAEQWKAWNESQTGKLDYFKRTSSSFFGDGSDDVLRIITDNLMKVQDKIYSSGLQVESKELQNKQEYLDTVDPALQGTVENVTNQRNIASGHIDAVLNECIDSIITDLRDRSESNKRGHSMAQIALLVFSVLRMVNFSPSGVSAQFSR